MALPPLLLSQHTIGTEVSAVGVGLHSGKKVKIVLHPAPINTGIIFTRADIPNAQAIVVGAQCVSDTRMASTIGEGNTISTVEHFMAACAGLAIDNLYVSVFGEEMPIMDGSASSFIFLLQSAGLVKQKAPRRFIRVKEQVRVEMGEKDDQKWAELRPYKTFRLTFDIQFDHPAIDQTGQHMQLDFSKDRFLEGIARARTFGFAHEVESLRHMGLANGGGLHNAIVIDEYKVLNHGGLRIDGEFVRHKMLDAIGDLYLAGSPLLAEYVAHKSGHALNNKLLRALFENPSNFEYVTLPIKPIETGYHSFEEVSN
jgi:UDP-3-O-[3-hydroxymyristoyl] N-acetylglucosamine deacetylase